MRKTTMLLLACLFFAFFQCCKSEPKVSNLDLVGKSSVKKTAPEKEIYSADTFHSKAFIVDLINDLVFRNQRDGWTLTSPDAQVNVKKLRAGGVDLVISALPTVKGDASVESLIELFDINAKLVEQTKGEVKIFNSFEETKKKGNEIAMMALLEGADALEGRLDLLTELRKRGLAVIGLVSSWSNAFAGSCEQSEHDGGLTEKGRELLRACRDNSITVDVTHTSRQAFWDILAEQAGTVLVSHTCARALRDHCRNLDDLQILALARYGGVMGLVFNPEFLGPETDTTIGLKDIVAHIMHIKSLGALNALALGTDFNGIKPPLELEDVSKLPTLTKALVQQGLDDSEILDILGNNAARLFSEVERNHGALKVTHDQVLRPLSIECNQATGDFEGTLQTSCNGYVLDHSARLKPGARQRARIQAIGGIPIRLQLFGDPGTPWQIEGQNLDGKVLFTRTAALDASGRAEVPLPQDRGLTRLFFSPTRESELKEIVVWGQTIDLPGSH